VGVISYIQNVYFSGLADDCRSFSNISVDSLLLSVSQVLNISKHELKYRNCFDAIGTTTNHLNYDKQLTSSRASFSILTLKVTVSLSRYNSMKKPLVTEMDFSISIFQFLRVKMLSAVLNGDLYSLFLTNVNETSLSATQLSQWSFINFFNATTANYTLNYPSETNSEITQKTSIASSSGFFTSTFNIIIVAVAAGVAMILLCLGYFFGTRFFGGDKNAKDDKIKKYSDIETGYEIYKKPTSETTVEPRRMMHTPLKRSNGIRMPSSAASDFADLDNVAMEESLNDETTSDGKGTDHINAPFAALRKKPLENTAKGASPLVTLLGPSKDKPNNTKSPTGGNHSKVAVLDDSTGEEAMDLADKDEEEFLRFKSVKTGRHYRIKKKKLDLSDKSKQLSSNTDSSPTNTAELTATVGELDVVLSDNNDQQLEQNRSPGIGGSNHVINDNNKKFTSWEENMRAELNKVKQTALRRNGAKGKIRGTKESGQRDDGVVGSDGENSHN